MGNFWGVALSALGIFRYCIIGKGKSTPYLENVKSGAIMNLFQKKEGTQMKKAISLFLALVLCLSLCACGKSEAVKNVEAMIDTLLGSAEYNVEEIEAIYAAFAELSEKEQKRVRNYDDFIKVSDDFYASALIGTWYPFELWHGELEKCFSPDFYIVLNADHTFESVAGEDGTTTGTWELKNKSLTLLGSKLDPKKLYILGTGADAENSISVDICYGEGFIYLDDFVRYCKEDDYFRVLGDILLSVDCANVDLNDYLGFTTYEEYGVDEWDVRNGAVYTRVILQNLLYEEGWMYFGNSSDFLLEVLYPDYEEVFHYPDGSTYTYEYPAGSENLFLFPFCSHWVSLPVLSQQTKDGSAETNLSTDAFTFGRAKGTLYFINKKYVVEAGTDKTDDKDYQYIILDNSQKYIELFFSGSPPLCVGQCEDGTPEH